MKSLCFAAALALLLHGLLFALKADWPAGESVAPPEQKTLSITMGYRTPQKPPAESIDGLPLEIPVPPEEAEEENQPVEHKKPVPPVAVKDKEINRVKPIPAKAPSLPKDQPMPEDEPAAPVNPPPFEVSDMDVSRENNPGTWEQPPEGNNPGSEDIPAEAEGAALNMPLPIVYPKAHEDNPLPEYPGMARRRGYEGVVTLEVFVSREGRVQEVRILKSSGYAVLDQEAEQVVKKYRFEPGRKNGQPVPMWGTVPIRFKLK